MNSSTNQQSSLTRREWTPADGTFDAPFNWEPSEVTVTPDLFALDADLVIKAYLVMAQTPHHTYKVLTVVPKQAVAVLSPNLMDRPLPDDMWPLSNVHVGVAVSSLEHEHRIDFLKDIPAAFRWIATNLPEETVWHLEQLPWVDEVVHTDHNPTPQRPVKDGEVAAAQHLPIGRRLVLEGKGMVPVHARVTGFDTLDDGSIQILLTGLSLTPPETGEPDDNREGHKSQ